MSDGTRKTEWLLTIKDSGKLRTGSINCGYGILPAQAAHLAIAELSIQNNGMFSMARLSFQGKTGFNVETYNWVNIDGCAEPACRVVFDAHGKAMMLDDALDAMDEELSETLQEDCGPFETSQQFFEFYAKEHERRFGEPWAPFAGGER